MDANRNFLETALTVGIDCEIITPDDVLRYLDPDVLAHHLPPDERTRLLAAALKTGRMDATLVFDTIEPRVLAENMPPHMLWACITEAASKMLDEDMPAAGAPDSAAPLPSTLTEDNSSLLSEGTSRFRRPNASRRPARFAQPRTSSNDISNRWNLAAHSASHDSTPPASSPASADDSFTDWAEDGVTGDSGPPKR